MKSSIPRAAKSLSAGESIFWCAPDPAGDLEYARKITPCGANTTQNTAAPILAAENGQTCIFLSSGRCDIRKLTFNVKPMNFKHTGVFPGAGRQLGLCDGENQRRRTAHQRSEPFCLHGRRDDCLRGGRRERLSCGRGEGHGRVGEGKRKVLRAGGKADSLDRRRLRQICRARDPARPAL